MGVSVGVVDILLQAEEFRRASVNVLHLRKGEGTEMGVNGVEGFPVVVDQSGALNEFRGNFL